MSAWELVLAAALVAVLAAAVLTAYGVREIGRLGRFWLALIVAGGVAGGLLVPLPFRQAQAAPEPNLGCCILCDGSGIGQVSRPACFNVYGGVSWYVGPCDSNYGCCTLKDGSRINETTQNECILIYGGVSWYSGYCN